MFCLVGGLVFGNVAVFASVNDFYFSDFTGDYYLSRDDEGISHLKVVESVTAVFPDFEQNKGICRQIPFTNQNGLNVTLPSLTRDNLKLTRNGVSENIYSIEKEGDYYNVCTGTEEYVLGEQIYVFEYEFEKVVTEFEENGRKWQELYWDTNGNGSTQRFDKVTARVHFEDIDVWSGESWCYVGAYGVSGQERCTITEMADGVEFTANTLNSFENLTFDAKLKKNSFVVPKPEEDYTYIWFAIILGLLCLIAIVLKFKKYLGSREKANYYKGIFVKPEYQPSKDYSLPEMAEIFIGKKKDMKVAMLLELIVKKKIVLKKIEKRKWNIIVNNLNGVDDEYISLLAILNGGTKPEENSEIVLKKRTASNRLIALRKKIESRIVGDLKRDELVEDGYSFGTNSGGVVYNIITTAIIFVPFAIMICMSIIVFFLIPAFNLSTTHGKIMVFETEFYLFAIVIITITVVILTILEKIINQYSDHTKKGLEASRYMDGLKLYIEMAEADRIKMLQSVEGADTSAEGIVKLYEKLLPYAAVFGLEESWMNEMKEYCKVEEVAEPDYLMQGIAISEISHSLNNAASIATTASTMSSSGGGSSSGFSGGGGGGFSGGGGGGGGFSGR